MRLPSSVSALQQQNMALLQEWYRAIIISILYGSSFSSNSPSQDIIFGLVGQQWNSQARTGVEDALSEINNRNDILLGYKLKYFSYSPTSGSQVYNEILVQWQFYAGFDFKLLNNVERVQQRGSTSWTIWADV